MRLHWRFLIYGLLVTTFYLGLPSFHYATALMIHLIVRYKDHPDGLFASIEIFPDKGGR